MFKDQRRLFFAFKVAAPWPEQLPKGRLVDSEQRHLTLAFLGEVDYGHLLRILPSIPLPSFKISLVGSFDRLLFLPKAHPRVVSFHVDWMEKSEVVGGYCKILVDWLRSRGFDPDVKDEFLPHVTLCRSPFSFHEWREVDFCLPLHLTGLHLYESVGGLQYRSIWEHAIGLPFIEIEHTADIAFKIYGETISQIYCHAFCALAWKFPQLLNYKPEDWDAESVDDIVKGLNIITAHIDAEGGCPFKAVSYHGDIESSTNGHLIWEMIVDV